MFWVVVLVVDGWVMVVGVEVVVVGWVMVVWEVFFFEFDIVWFCVKCIDKFVGVFGIV